MSMTNALTEFKETLDSSNLLCVHIKDCSGNGIVLKIGYTTEELEMFYTQMNFTYESGYFGDGLSGTIWLLDDSWYERGQDQYEKSWYWVRRECPKIPAKCFYSN